MQVTYLIRRNPRLWLIGLGLAAVQSTAQVTISNVEVADQRVARSTLFVASILTATSGSVVVSGELRSSGGQVLSFSSRPEIIAAGPGILRAADLDYSSFSYASDPTAQAVAQSYRLGSGTYNFCLRIEPEGGGEWSEEYCTDLEVEDLLFMEPVYPFDADTIAEIRPNLIWTISSNRLPAGQTARVVLTPKAASDNAAKALANDKPLFVLPNAQPTTGLYPMAATSLVAGECYAWQVERMADGLVIDRTEPWWFCVSEHLEPVPNKYVLIGDQSNAVYESTDGWIHFRFDEPYPVELAEMQVLDAKGVAIPVAADKEIGDSIGSGKGVGINLYEFDLMPYGLKAGYYTLRIHDGKGRKHHLKFHIER
jgi:hypothetical protein